MDLELKNAIEASNKLIETLRAEVEAVKGTDALTEQKMARIGGELATTLAAKTALEARLTAVETAAARPGLAEGAEVTDEHKDAFVAYLRKSTDYGVKSALEGIQTKQVNLVAPGANGGLAVPVAIAQEIARVAANISPIRSLARVVTVGTSEYKELLNLGGATGEWLGETDTHNVTVTPTIKEVKPTFGEVAARAQATNWSLEDIFFDVENWISLELAQTFADMEAAAFVAGNGVSKPTGLLNGTVVPTKASGEAADFGADPYDNLIDLVFGVKAAYRSNAAFVLNSATLPRLVKVKDTTGNYLYQQSVAAGVPSTILGYSVYTDENMPDVAAAAKPILFGDFNRGYLIADRVGMSMLVNPYKTSGLVEFEARKRVGGIVKDAAALVALRIAAS